MKTFTISLATLLLIGKISATKLQDETVAGGASNCCGWCGGRGKGRARAARYVPTRYVSAYVPEPECPCGDEFCDLTDRLDAILDEDVVAIKGKQASNSQKIDNVTLNQDLNLGASQIICDKLLAIETQLTEANEAAVGGAFDPPASGCTVDININGCGDCDVEKPCECEECEDLGEVLPPADPVCLAENNIFTEGTARFFQTYPLPPCEDNRFFLMSAAVNEGEDVETIHRWSGDDFPEGELTQAAALVQESDVAEDFLKWTADGTLAATQTLIDLGIGGVQLKDDSGNCLGYLESPNFEDKTLIQSVPCQTEADLNVDTITNQLWNINEAEGEELFYIENVCSGLVIKKNREGTECNADDVYADQPDCYLKHFQAELVEKNKCVDAKFNVNDCAFQMELL